MGGPEQICQWAACGRPFPRRENEGERDYRRRRFCGTPCFKSAVGAQGRRPVPVVVAGPLFPHAHFRRWSQVPERCPRDAGLWRVLPDSGVVCRLCGFERLVAEALAADGRGTAELLLDALG